MKVALLRGINVGGHRKLPMAELRELALDLGLTSVATYIQSGNLLFEGDASGLQAAIRERWGYDVPVIVRYRASLADALRRQPFGPDPDERWTHIVFCDRPPSGTLDPARHPGDRVVIDGNEVFVRYCQGPGTSKLTLDRLETDLGVRATGRNLRTVRELLERM